MSIENNCQRLPDYEEFAEKIAILSLPISSSELHGIICGYLCVGANEQVERYIQALVINSNKDELTRAAATAIFNIYAITSEQIKSSNFVFQLLLPSDYALLIDRAKAFSQWCEGFTQGINLAGVNYENLAHEDTREALQHIVEFAELDYDSLDVEEEDEKSLMEISEYARVAVLRLKEDLGELVNPSNAKH